MVATGETVGLAEWIIDDTCLVMYNLGLLHILDFLLSQDQGGLTLLAKKVAIS